MTREMPAAVYVGDGRLEVQHVSTPDLAPGDVGTLTITLGLGAYTLYCSLPDHEAAGMKATINVR